MSSPKTQHICFDCGRQYQEYQSLHVHLKMKHKQQVKIQEYSNHKYEIYEEEFLIIEDQILTFFGELGEKSSYSLQTLIQKKLYDSSKNAPGKNHYSSNSIVNNPFQILDQSQQISLKIDFLENLKLEKNLQKQIVINDMRNLYSILEGEINKWYYADPLDYQINFQQQFCLDNIPKLLINYKKKNLKLKIPQISIFLLWVGKFLKDNFFKQICQIIMLLAQKMEQFNKEKDRNNNWTQLLRQLKKERVLQKSYENMRLSLKKDQFIRMSNLFCQWSSKMLKLIQSLNIDK